VACQSRVVFPPKIVAHQFLAAVKDWFLSTNFF
jgi:hypothetical protein